MSSVLSPQRASTEQTGSARRGLPEFGRLAYTALGANALLIAILLLTNRRWSAVSVLAGLVVGLAVYGSLHLFVGRGLEPLVASVRGHAKPAAGGPTMLFVCLLPLKYLLLGGLLYLLVRAGHVSLVWLGVGFLVTQATITTATVLHLMRTPRL
jgi:hypothetical protein